MAKEVKMIREQNGYYEIETAYVGFSWTTLFFGWLVPLFRRDWVRFFLMFVLEYYISVTVVGIPVLLLAFACFYNEMHMDHLIKQGYRAAH